MAQFRTVARHRLDQLTFIETGLSRVAETPVSMKPMPRRDHSRPLGPIDRLF